MSSLEGVLAVWWREVVVYTREKERAISSVVTPLIWLFAFGAGLGASISVAGLNYQSFIFPGILAMNVLFTSMFYGMYVVWDKKLDVLKEILIAPQPRWVAFSGKVLGGLTICAIQATILMAVGALFMGIEITPLSYLSALAGALLFGMGSASLGLFIGAKLNSPDSFSLVMSFVMWPLFLTSGALYPIEHLPAYLQVLVHVNPMAYGVDLVRGALLNAWTYGPLLDAGVLLAFGALFFWLGKSAFEKMNLG
ncbi:ABC-2 type transporter [uncultured archaeon]|nr:ABC-2 type transporter [uncultured archaeon]